MFGLCHWSSGWSCGWISVRNCQMYRSHRGGLLQQTCLVQKKLSLKALLAETESTSMVILAVKVGALSREAWETDIGTLIKKNKDHMHCVSNLYWNLYKQPSHSLGCHILQSQASPFSDLPVLLSSSVCLLVLVSIFASQITSALIFSKTDVFLLSFAMQGLSVGLLFALVFSFSRLS